MDAVEEIKQRLSIEDVLGEYMQLKRAGRNWRGLSPFSSEKTPSLMISPEKQIWHDFSSGKGGNMFSFVMEVEGLEFKEALELLARKAGIDLDQYRKGSRGPSSKDKERLYTALELAAKFYQTQFTRNDVALEYILKKRAFTKETALTWQLGYAPNTGDALSVFLKAKGFNDQEIKLAGLSARGYKGTTDMFRGRLMIPLCDPQGRIIGFTARLLVDDPNAPKYINTPSTPLYDKSRHVFGLHLAKEAIRKVKYVVLAEGNLDVIMSHQAGVKQVVATAGTALTEQHLKALSRFTGDIRLSFDADKAGIQATERAIPVAAKVGVSLSIITIPSGKDPDELIKQSPKRWEDAIEKQQYAIDWLIQHYTELLDLNSAQGKKEFSDVILKVIRSLQDTVEQDHYIGVLADLLQVSKQALIDKLTTQAQGVAAPRLQRKAEQTPKELDADVIDKRKTEEHLLALTLLHPKLRDYLDPITPDMVSHDDTRVILEFVKAHKEFDGTGTSVAALQPVAEYSKILTLVYETLYQDLEPIEVQYEASRLQAKLIKQFVHIQKKRISQQLHTVSTQEATELLTRVKQLDELLNKYQGGAPRGTKE